MIPTDVKPPQQLQSVEDLGGGWIDCVAVDHPGRVEA
jgi:hypothetical protein